MSVKLFVVGAAGTGKTTFSKAFKDWMINQQYDAIILNLDPGVDYLPYVPDVDVRDWISLAQIMEEYSLGPNGAQILAADFIANNIDEIKNAVEKYDTDYVIIDTPGQLELFAFRTSSEFVVNTLSQDHGIFAFLMDPMLLSSPSGFISNILLANSVFFRFYRPYMNVLTKTDLANSETLKQIDEWSENANILYESLRSEKRGTLSSFSTELFRALETLNVFKKLFRTSAVELTGFEDIYNDIQQVFYGGEDLEKR